ncbi:lytic transglycosylase domain-containing protein [Microbacterium cremeum]|uniref:lytic transglycosylase domain-containing protein n=1 Tax=Microbacterium cremeum TaxID=2782169 RepID=UPI001E62A0C3|nr:lytic transglycosylase domain-containing protein [Microbacterium cremeum]
MSDRADEAHAGTARAAGGSPGTWLVIAVLATLAVLAGWIVAGALQTPDPDGYLVAPPADAEPAVGDSSADAPQPQDSVATRGAGNADRVDAEWAARTAAATGIPLRVLLGYAGAELAMTADAPGCGIRWSTLAALGRIESAHGTHAGSVIGEDGLTRPGIFGIDLTGDSSARIDDTDDGAWDGKADIDRAVGPMQFIPATWEAWGADGNGDGVNDPQHIDDAALAAARYLCHHGDLTQPGNWRTAIFAYNHLDSYVNAVARAANDYAGRAPRG